MDPISAAAAYSTAQATENVKTEAGVKVMKMALDQDKAVLELLAKTLQTATTGLGRKIDVQA
ncbi:MAG TPA: putative motility protein [Planctomycetota bacterium]|nr:putative motility protein [Planctomycetota bacterium]